MFIEICNYKIYKILILCFLKIEKIIFEFIVDHNNNKFKMLEYKRKWNICLWIFQ